MNPFSWQERTELLLKTANVEKLRNSHVFIAGLGGVGAFAAEMLCRAGIGSLTIADGDCVTPTNRNRQLIALQSTQGRRKVEVMAERLYDINPELNLTIHDTFLRDGITRQLVNKPFDYVVDAIDTVSPKIFFIHHVVSSGLPLISSMGAGGKLDPSKVFVADFANTYQCNLANQIRKKLRKLGVDSSFKAVFSTEPVCPESLMFIENESNKKTSAGTISYLPAIFGCYCASVVIRDLLCIPYELALRPTSKKNPKINKIFQTKSPNDCLDEAQ